MEKEIDKSSLTKCAEYYLGLDRVKVRIGSAIVPRIHELGYGEEENDETY